MTHLKIHRSPVAPPCSIANSSPWFCRISSISLLKTSPLGINSTTGGGGGIGVRTIRCMAHPRRVRMVAKQIMRKLSDMLLTNKVLQYAILPEAALGADRYLSSLTTISDVAVSSDLQVLEILDRTRDENEKLAIEGESDDFEEPSDRGNNDVEWEGDGIDDEGIIYVK